MVANHKLTAVIKGRIITEIEHQSNAVTIIFKDRSKMKIKTAPSASISDLSGGTVQKIRQQDTILNIDFVDGSTLGIHTQEATSSVMLRDKQGKMEYAD